jgi:hypothetical protein
MQKKKKTQININQTQEGIGTVTSLWRRAMEGVEWGM